MSKVGTGGGFFSSSARVRGKLTGGFPLEFPVIAVSGGPVLSGMQRGTNMVHIAGAGVE